MEKLLRGSITSALGIGISRILGLVREVLTASFFGANLQTDAFFLAWKIPNIFRRILGEGGFNPIIIPTLGRLSEEERKTYLSALFFYIALTSLAVSVILSLSAPFIVELISHETAKGFLENAILYLRLLSFYLFFASLNAFFMSFLQFKGKFFASYLSQAIFNLTVIGFILLFHPRWGILSIVYGALVGGLLQVLFVFYLYKKHGGELFLNTHPLGEVKNFFKKLVPQIGSAGIGHLSTLVEAFFATAVGGGILSSLYYAMRIFQLGVSLVSVSLTNVSLSEVSKNKENALREGLKLAILLSVPASLGLFILSRDITEVIYRHGVFGEADTQRVSLYLSLYSLGLVPLTLFQVAKVKLYKSGKLEKAFLYSLLWFGVEITVAGVGIFLFHLGGWVIALSYTLGVSLTFLLFLLKEGLSNLLSLLREIKPIFYLLWVLEVLFLLGLKEIFQNPYAVVFLGIFTFGVLYLWILYKKG